MELELIKFIKEHENWEELLSTEPYNLKISRDEGYIMFKYNQISSDFSLPIVLECRGIILRERDFKPVCVPFFKFGNYGESYCPEIDWESASAQQKVDGSLIKVWCDEGKWHISTNGTIDAFKANLESIHHHSYGELFMDALGVEDDNQWFLDYMFEKGFTYMFELVSPENRVVIPYDELNVYFLGVRDNETLEELDPEDFAATNAALMLMDIPERYDLHSLADVQLAASKLPWDEEGYVVCDKNFNRVKIKSPEYVKAHYARNNSVISYERLLDVVLSGEKAEFLIYASDFKDDLEHIETSYHSMLKEVRDTIAEMHPESFASRKDFAAAVQTKPTWMSGFLFKYDKLDEFLAKITTTKWIEFMKQRGDLA